MYMVTRKYYIKNSLANSNHVPITRPTRGQENEYNFPRVKLINRYVVNDISRTMKWDNMLFPAEKAGLLGRQKLCVSESIYQIFVQLMFFKTQIF